MFLFFVLYLLMPSANWGLIFGPVNFGVLLEALGSFLIHIFLDSVIYDIYSYCI